MTATPDGATLVRMYEVMALVQACDERFRSMLTGGQIQLAYYSPRGQEAIAAALAVCLEPTDYLVTTYRGLHDHIAKGVDLDRLWAEFLGKEGGTCAGRGGPMHLTDPDVGIMMTTGVVGSGMPVANGLALASKLRGENRVTVVSFGDGASNIGAFHEALNLAALWDLPVVFLCQNNRYAEHTARPLHQKIERISDRADGYVMAGVTVDGNDPVSMCGALGEAVDRARAGGGPTLVEADTFRFFGHTFGDRMSYIPPEELEAAIAADPIPRYRQRLADEGHATEEELVAIEAAAEERVSRAAAFALESTEPPPAELHLHVYAGAGA